MAGDGTDDDGVDAVILPWRPITRQDEGRITEKQVLKERGLRIHPMSGAGSIKHDGSDNEVLAEVKDANKCLTLDGTYLLNFYKRAAQQSLDALFIVKFANGVVLEGKLTVRHPGGTSG